MNIYDKIKQFAPNTGEPKFVKKFIGLRDDYSGEEIDEGDDVRSTYCIYKLNYQSCDPCFGASGLEFEFSEKYKIDMWYFLQGEYHFIDGSGYKQFCTCFNMMKEAMANIEKQDSLWQHAYTFDSMCRTSRILAATKLIENGIIEPWQLIR